MKTHGIRLPMAHWQLEVAAALGLALVLSSDRARAQTAAPGNEPALPEAAAEPAPVPAPDSAPTAPETSTAGSTTGPGATGAQNAAPPAAPPPAPSVAADASLAPSSNAADAQAEQAAVEAASDLGGDSARFQAYGFADFTYSRLLSDRHGLQASDMPYPTFYVGNFNLYLGADLGKSWRSLSEVRFTYLPDGVNSRDFAAGTSSRTSTTATDYSDFSREVKVGGVIIERVWVEYAADPLLTIRAGQWLTPYGIWNVDHGSTVIIGTTRPFIVGADMFPRHQTGIELYGSYGLGSSQAGYHLTLSNGRGPVESYRDLDGNKAVGWRLWFKNDSEIGTITLGTSGYRGRYTDRGLETNVGAAGITNSYPIASRYEELSLALDAKWTRGGFLLQSEAILRDQKYDNKYRPAAMSMGGPPGWTPDTRNYGVYLLTGYRTPWIGAMPFIGGEYYYTSRANFIPDSAAIWGGLNVRPTERVVLKLQGTHAWFPMSWSGSPKSKPMDLLTAQVAWSF